MNKSRFSEYEMRFILEQVEKGAHINDVCAVMGISHATFYNWRNRLSHRKGGDYAQIDKLESENTRLKKIIQQLENDKKLLLAELKKRRW
ncbi:transposase [Enterobacter asburiae]